MDNTGFQASGSSILATGGAGFVGTHTVVELLESGYDVVVMDNLANANMGLRYFIHVVDLARGHVSALKLIEKSCGLKIYNLGTGTPYSVLDIVNAFEKASGKKIPYIFSERRAGDLASTYCDRSLATKELGWTAQYDLEKICVDMWTWQSNNPYGYMKDKQV